jgi:hypothetical protein
MRLCSVTREPLFIGGPGDAQSPQLHLFIPDRRLYTLFKGITVTPCFVRASQRVFTRSSLLYTRHLSSLLHTTPFTHLACLRVACSSDKAGATTSTIPSAPKRPSTPLQPWEVPEASLMIPSCSAPEPSQWAVFLIDPHLQHWCPVMPNQPRANHHLRTVLMRFK